MGALFIAASGSGCSLTFMTPPPASVPGRARPHVDCTTSYLAPILDSAAAAYQLAGVAYISTLDEARFREYPISKQADMAIGGALAAAFVGSAIYGYASASRCRRVKRGPANDEYLPGVSGLGVGAPSAPGAASVSGRIE